MPDLEEEVLAAIGHFFHVIAFPADLTYGGGLGLQLGTQTVRTIDLMRADGPQIVIATQKAAEPCNVSADLQSGVVCQSAVVHQSTVDLQSAVVLQGPIL